jgi:hypothetical protein
MRLEPRLAAGVCWVGAGLPIVATSVEAVLVLAGVETLSIPVVGAIAAALRSLVVFDVAGGAFESNPSAILLLFLLTAVAWSVEGITVFRLREREYAYAAAGFVTLFSLLFLLAYSPVFASDVPVVQLGGFALLAAVASGAAWGTVLVYDWDSELDETTREELSAAREAAREARRTFEDELDARLDARTRDRLGLVARGAVQDAEERIEAFREDCERIDHEADRLETATGDGPRDRARAAAGLREEAEELDPGERIDRIAETLADRVGTEVREEFGDVHLVSRYGGAYEVRNLTAYNELRLPSVGTTAQVGGAAHDLGERIATAAEDRPLPETATAIDAARTHLEELRTHVDEQESRFADRAVTADERVEVATAEIGTVEGAPGGRLEQLLVDGRYETDPPPGPSATAVEDALAAGRDLLHDCDFPAAHERAEAAVETAERLVAVAEFFRAVDEAIAHRTESVPIPAATGAELAAVLEPAFERGRAVDYSVDGDRVRFRFEDEDGGRREESEPGDGEVAPDRPTGNGVRPEDVVDEVVYVLRELRGDADAVRTTDVVELQTADLPEQCTASGVLENLTRFGERQHGVDSFELQPGSPPGYLELRVEEEERPDDVIDRIHERYLNRYGQ